VFLIHYYPPCANSSIAPEVVQGFCIPSSIKSIDMPLTKFHDVSDDIRLQALVDNCDDRREETYMKDLSRDELEIRLQKVAENCIKVNDLEEELKEIKAEFKDKIDPMKADNKHLLWRLRTVKPKSKAFFSTSWKTE